MYLSENGHKVSKIEEIYENIIDEEDEWKYNIIKKSLGKTLGSFFVW